MFSTNSRTQTVKIGVFYLLLFLAILTLNLLQLPMADEWAQWPSRPVSGNGFEFAFQAYLGWNSRIGEFLLRLALYYLGNDIFQHQLIFGVMNTFAFFILIINIFIIIRNNFPKCDTQDATFIAFILIAIYLSSSFNQDFFWEPATFGYGWALLFLSFWVLPYARFLHTSQVALPLSIKSYFSLKEILKALLFFIVAIPIGMGSEILSPATLFMITLIFLYYIFIRKVFPPLWFVMGALGLFAGWLALVLAPGPAIRRKVFLEIDPHYFDITPQIVLARIPSIIYFRLAFFSVLYYSTYIFRIVLDIRNKKYQFAFKDWLIFGLGLAGSFGILVAAIAIPSLPSRAAILYTIFWMFGCCLIFLQYQQDKNEFYKYLVTPIILLLAFALMRGINNILQILIVVQILGIVIYTRLRKIPQISLLLMAIVLFCINIFGYITYRQHMLAFHSMILQQKARGEMNVIIDWKYFPNSHPNVKAFDLPAEGDYAAWVYGPMANYYGLSNITFKDDEEINE